MQLNILPLHKNAAEFYKNHKNFHEGDSGLDLFFMEDIIIPGKTTVKVKLGIACQATLNKTPTSYYIYPRSSISKTPLRLANCVGIIDQGYTGELMAYFDNIYEKDYKISKGERLLQICGPDLKPFSFKIVDNLRKTSRGTKGFGSTGTK